MILIRYVFFAIIFGTYSLEQCSAGTLRTDSHIEKLSTESELTVNTRPLIGVITEPSVDGNEIIVGSYVKFIEQAGARAVAIRSSRSKDEILERLQFMNGLFLPGGGTDITPDRSHYYNATRTAVTYAVNAIRNGESFPIWGTCLGWEELAEMLSNDDGSVLTDSGVFNSSDQGLALKMTPYARENSIMFSSLPDHILSAIQNKPLTYNSHSQGVTPEQFRRHTKLHNTFHLLATGNDRNGREFVAAVESKTLAGVFAVQFHPEKSQFEWYSKLKELRHDAEMVYLSQHFANLFISYARKSSRQAPKEMVNKWTIELDDMKRKVNGEEGYFFEVYVFEP